MKFTFCKQILPLLIFSVLFFYSFAESVSSIDSLENESQTWSLSASNDSTVRFYLTSKPVDTITTHKSKREPYLQIVCLKNNEYQVLLNNDYGLYKPPIMSVNGQDFNFASSVGGSFLSYIKPQETVQVLKKLSNSFEVKIFSQSVSGTYSVDTYTLAGFQKLFMQFQRMCGEEEF